MASHLTETGGFAPGTIPADRSRIVALVGRGGTGEVYRADIRWAVCALLTASHGFLGIRERAGATVGLSSEADNQIAAGAMALS